MGISDLNFRQPRPSRFFFPEIREGSEDFIPEPVKRGSRISATFQNDGTPIDLERARNKEIKVDRVSILPSYEDGSKQ